MKPIRLEITPEDVEKAKWEQETFDAQKTHNKFACNTNYIGYLGEMIFNDYLQSTNHDYEWLQFTKQEWDDPDFIIGSKTVDLKTTFHPMMWMQKEVHDIYVYAQMANDLSYMEIRGWYSKEEITQMKKMGNYQTVERSGRVDYLFNPLFMNPLESLFEKCYIPETPTP